MFVWTQTNSKLNQRVAVIKSLHTVRGLRARVIDGCETLNREDHKYSNMTLLLHLQAIWCKTNTLQRQCFAYSTAPIQLLRLKRNRENRWPVQVLQCGILQSDHYAGIPRNGQRTNERDTILIQNQNENSNCGGGYIDWKFLEVYT